MIIDAHHHLELTADYVARLVDNCARNQVDRVCLFGAGRRAAAFGIAADPAVLAAAEQHPGLIVPFCTFDLGLDQPGKVDEAVRQGFRGVKFINPLRNYDDRSFYPVYERCSALQVPVLFHLGIVARSATDHLGDIDNNRHRPIYLDTLARAFPELNLLGAHLGNPWYEEAAMAARWNSNLYFDLSGSTLKCKSARFLGDLLWWTPTTRYRDPLRRYAWDKIVFGSDVPPEEISDVMADYQRVMTELAVPAAVQANVMGGTLARLLKLA